MHSLGIVFLLAIVALIFGATAGLLPMRAVRLQIGTLLAADTTTLAPAVNANKIALVNAAFAMREDLAIGALSFATFTGSTPLAGAAGPQGSGVDPATQRQIVTVLAPAGGWRWRCTVAPGAPETIYGYALTDNAGAVLLGVQLLALPVTIQNIGDQIDLGDIQVILNNPPFALS